MESSPTSGVRTRVKLFESGTAVSNSTDATPRVENKRMQPMVRTPLDNAAVGSEYLHSTSPDRQISSTTNRMSINSSALPHSAPPKVVLSPTKKVLSLNGPVSKRYYDIKARRSILRGKGGRKDPSLLPGEAATESTEDHLSDEHSDPTAPSAGKSTSTNPTHRVWSESQQQEDQHQTLDRRVGVEDGGAGWFSPPVEHSASSSSSTDQNKGPPAYSPEIRTHTPSPPPSTYQSKVARLRTLRSRSPYFTAHQDHRELKRNLEAASVILNEEKESSVGSGGSSSTRSSLSREEVKKVAERALKLAKVRPESSSLPRAALTKASPLQQMLAEKRQRKTTFHPPKAKHPGPSVTIGKTAASVDRLPPLSSNTTTSDTTQTRTSTSASPPLPVSARLTRSERYAMIKAKTNQPHRRSTSRGRGGATTSDEDSLDVSRTTDDSAIPYQYHASHRKDFPVFGYSQRFIAMTRQAGPDRTHSPYDDSSTITSESPAVTGSETQTISSADETGNEAPCAHPLFRPTREAPAHYTGRYRRTHFPPPMSVPVRYASAVGNSHQSTTSSSTGENTGSVGGSDSTNRAVNSSFASRAERARALKVALQRQEKPFHQPPQHQDQQQQYQDFSWSHGEEKQKAIISPAYGNQSETQSPKKRGLENTFLDSRFDPSNINKRNSSGSNEGNTNNEFFDRLCKPGVVPVKTSESETDSGEEAFFHPQNRRRDQLESISSSYGTSTSGSIDARPERVDRLESPYAAASVDATSASTTLDGVGILDMESSIENSGPGSNLSKRKSPFQRQGGIPPPPPPLPVSSYYYDRKSDDSYDTADEIEQARSPTEPEPSPAKSSLTQTSNNDAMKWWNKNYAQLVAEKADHPISQLDNHDPRRGLDPVQVKTMHHQIRNDGDDEDDEDVFSGLEEEKKDESNASGEESDDIPNPQSNPKATSAAASSLSRTGPLKPILIKSPREAKSPSSQRSPLSPRSNVLRVTSPQSSGMLISPRSQANSNSSPSVLAFKAKKAEGLLQKKVETIDEESTVDDESRDKQKPKERPSRNTEDLLDDSVMVASMSISKATGKDGQPQQSQQGDHLALLNLGYSLFESISSFCKLPKRPLLEANACVEKSHQSCREVEEGSSLSNSYTMRDKRSDAPSSAGEYVMRNADALKDHTLRQRDPEVWAMLEARERAQRQRSAGHGDFEETLAMQESDKNSADSIDRSFAYDKRREEAQTELLIIANQAISLYGGSAKGKETESEMLQGLNATSLARKMSKDAPTSSKDDATVSYKSDTSGTAHISVFFAVLKKEGIEVLKLGRRNKWQPRFLTVTVEVMNLTVNHHQHGHGTSDSQCPLGLLWLKHRPDSKQGLSSLKKQGRGGLPFSSLQKLESVHGEDASDALESLNKLPRKLRVLFPTLNGVSIEYSFIGVDGSLEKRSVLFCFKTENDATAFTAAMETIASIVSRGLDGARGLDP